MATPVEIERAGVVKDEVTGTLQEGHSMKSELFWNRSVDRQYKSAPIQSGHHSYHTVTSTGQMQMPHVHAHNPHYQHLDQQSNLTSYVSETDKTKLSSLTKYFLNRAELDKCQPRPDIQQVNQVNQPLLDLQKDLCSPSFVQLGNNKNSPKKLKLKEKSKSLKSKKRKRDSKDEDYNIHKIKKRLTPGATPRYINCTKRVADIVALEHIDAATMALEMGYTNPFEKISSVDKDVSASKDKSTDQNNEEGSKKVSPVENIQQVLDYRKTSGCACLSALTVPDVAAHRLEVFTLDRNSRDFFIMGLFRSAAVPNTVSSKNLDRQRYRFNYRLLNTRICQACFLFVNNIGAKFMKNLKKHFNEIGVKSRTHGNQGRKPCHALGDEDIGRVVEFLIKFAETHGTPVKSSSKGKRKNSKRVVHLPASQTFINIFKEFKTHCTNTGIREIASSTFRKVWTSHATHIKMNQVYESPTKKKSVKNTVSPLTSVTKVSGICSSFDSSDKSNVANSSLSLAPISKNDSQEKADCGKHSPKPDVDRNSSLTSTSVESCSGNTVNVPVSATCGYKNGAVEIMQTPMMPLYMNGSLGDMNSWRQQPPNVSQNPDSFLHQSPIVKPFLSQPNDIIVVPIVSQAGLQNPPFYENKSLANHDQQDGTLDLSPLPKFTNEQTFHLHNMQGHHW